MITIACEQGSELWLEAKLGVASTSNFAKIFAEGKTDKFVQGKGYWLYMRKLAGERDSGKTQISYTNKNMDNGVDLEPFAREYYEALHGCEVKQVGFIKMNEDVGCSPDGLVGDEGLIEIKSVIPSTQIATILSGKMPTEHKAQVQGQLYVTGRKWCDFISYSPTMKSRPFFCVRVFRDGEYLAKLDVAVIKFVAELRDMINKVNDSVF